MTALDVQTPEEYAARNLQGAQNINFRALDFSQQVSKLAPPDPLSTLLHCRQL